MTLPLLKAPVTLAATETGKENTPTTTQQNNTTPSVEPTSARSLHRQSSRVFQNMSNMVNPQVQDTEALKPTQPITGEGNETPDDATAWLIPTPKKETAAAGVARLDSNLAAIAVLLKSIENRPDKGCPPDNSRVNDALRCAQDARTLAENCNTTLGDIRRQHAELQSQVKNTTGPPPARLSEDPSFVNIYDVTKTHGEAISTMASSITSLNATVSALSTKYTAIENATSSLQHSMAGIMAKLDAKDHPPLPLLGHSLAPTIQTHTVWNETPSISTSSKRPFPSSFGGSGENMSAQTSLFDGFRGINNAFGNTNKRARIDFQQGTGYEVQYGYTQMDASPVDTVRRLVSLVPGLQMSDTLRPSTWSHTSNGSILSLRFYSLDKAQRFVNAVTATESQEFIGKRAALVDIPTENTTTIPRSPIARLDRTPISTHIAAWNVNGNLALKLRRKEVREMIINHDITFLGETWLDKHEGDMVALPRGYDIVSKTRPRQVSASSQGASGGVAFIFKANISITVVEATTEPDILVLDTGDAFLVGAYIAPRNSKWEKWTRKDPETALMETMAYLTILDGNKPMRLVGDLNARIGDKSWPNSWIRQSADKMVDGRGAWLLRLAKEFGLVIVNGSKADTSPVGEFTSHQRGNATVDYILCPLNEAQLLSDNVFTVSNALSRWSDHSFLSLNVESASTPRPTNMTTLKVPSPDETEEIMRTKRPCWFNQKGSIDIKARAIAARRESREECLRRAYGPVTATDPKPLSVAMAIYTKTTPGNGQWRSFVAYSWGCLSERIDTAEIPTQHAHNHTAATLYAIAGLLSQQPSARKIIIYGPPGGILSLIGDGMARQVNMNYPATFGESARALVTSLHARAAAVDIRSPTTEFHLELRRTLSAEAKLAWRKCSRQGRNTPTLVNTAQTANAPMEDLAQSIYPKVIIRLPKKDKPEREDTSNETWVSLSGLAAVRTRKEVRTVMKDNLQRLVDAESPREWWQIVKSFTTDKPRPSLVTAPQLGNDFYKRLNPPDSPPPHYDESLRQHYRLLADAIPSNTMDTSQEQFFAREWTTSEIGNIKSRLAKRSPRSSTGIDKTSYAKIMDIPNEDLADLFNECIREGASPEDWLTTKLIGIQKKGKPPDAPGSYRLIGLESCLLKVLTLLIDTRLREWAESNNYLPKTQNGFRRGLRTHNNSFLLKTAIDKARKDGKPLYVAFVDLTNAFPSTDTPALWVKMRRANIGGPIFDWLRMVYQRMRYVVAHNGEMTTAFKSMIGLLTGDSLSPMLWIIFFADLFITILDHEDDITFNGKRVSHVEQADDVGLLSTSWIALFTKLTAFFVWCCLNFMLLSVSKTKWMVFGAPPRILPPLTVDGKRLELVSLYKFIGIIFQSTTADIFDAQYEERASKALKVANVLYSVEKHIGSLAPTYGYKLYMAQIDPHLTFGSEVCLDVAKKGIARLEKEQMAFIRRLLRISKRCSVAPLFTETGIMPIRYRRVILALDYAWYLASKCPKDSLPHDAWLEVLAMWHNGDPCWLSDLGLVLKGLNVEPPEPCVYTERPLFDELIQKVYGACDEWLQNSINDNKRLAILQERFRREGQQDAPKRGLTKASLRGYLLIKNVDYRTAMTQLLMSEHPLAIEQLRRPDGQRRPRIPREWRLCRMCKEEVETEHHAILECTASTRIVECREDMWKGLTKRKDFEDQELSRDMEASEQLAKLIAWENGATKVGKLVFEVFQTFQTMPLYIPNREQWEEVDNENEIEEEIDDELDGGWG